MKIINSLPPMWDRINATFDIGMKPVIFTFGPVIYNPNGGKITKELEAHEEIHWQRQGDADEGIMAWWNQYLVDPGFRLEEELPAHRAEYRAFCKRHAGHSARHKYLAFVSQRLCGPLYGNLLSIDAARTRILTP